MREYITSDLHLLHTNIIKYAERNNYKPTDEDCMKMSWEIVSSIDNQIPDEPDVILWNLGDLFYGPLFSKASFDGLTVFVDVMKGKHRTLNLILGNHDKQFLEFSNVNEKFDNLNEVFTKLGFDNVYDKPYLYIDFDTKKKFIFSHEPFFDTFSNEIYNIHGHTHQMSVDKDYFTIDIENYKMVKKAYDDSNRYLPEPVKLEHWEQKIVDPTKYINVCWDATDGNVIKLQDIIKELSK